MPESAKATRARSRGTPKVSPGSTPESHTATASPEFVLATRKPAQKGSLHRVPSSRRNESAGREHVEVIVTRRSRQVSLPPKHGSASSSSFPFAKWDDDSSQSGVDSIRVIHQANTMQADQVEPSAPPSARGKGVGMPSSSPKKGAGTGLRLREPLPPPLFRGSPRRASGGTKKIQRKSSARSNRPIDKEKPMPMEGHRGSVGSNLLAPPTSRPKSTTPRTLQWRNMMMCSGRNASLSSFPTSSKSREEAILRLTLSNEAPRSKPILMLYRPIGTGYREFSLNRSPGPRRGSPGRVGSESPVKPTRERSGPWNSPIVRTKTAQPSSARRMQPATEYDIDEDAVSPSEEKSPSPPSESPGPRALSMESASTSPYGADELRECSL